ncbi:hypothetical protein cyc_03123 [Cyclospora cayetanensis]|uniref:Uncharacterized protein n=1 Tax=Cyclospora cayetanensis TaxID=88456 RepID=A0A1D3CZ29_9EIME|nr:hypothetical protein cyc_03123 [Cyclospora cayetanensis]
MARRGAASSDTIAASFTPAEFVPSRTLTAQSKSISLSLIKVPKFVAESWRSAVADATAGILKNDNGKPLSFCSVLCFCSTSLYQRCADNPDKPESFISCLLCFFALVSASDSPDTLFPSLLCTLFEQQVLIVRDPLTGGACHLESIFLQNDKSLVLQKNGKQLLDVIGELQSRTNFQPKLDHRYQQVLHKRHVAEDLHKSRGTVEEMRRDPGLDSLHTLFQFYTPRASLSAEENAKRGLESISRAKAKQKRGAVLDADSLKVKLFKMFDAAGASGLQLKQIASQTQQPLSHVKMIVEEIAEQRKRLSDRKAVYFLKQQYSIVQKVCNTISCLLSLLSAAVGEEPPVAKKPKLN